MVIFHGRSLRKNTGGRYREARSHRLYELGRESVEVKIGKKKTKQVTTRGNGIKNRALALDEANVLDPDTKRYNKTKINSVLENQANPHFVRRNTMTKGALIETETCTAKIINRPGQEGFINALLVKKK